MEPINAEFADGDTKPVSGFGVKKKPANTGVRAGRPQKPSKPAKSISQLRANSVSRYKTGISELDRVLGGGFVDGMAVLLGGAPGAGKSTLCLMIAESFAKAEKKVLYCSGEESEGQIASRAQRMKVDSDRIKVVSETSLEKILGQIVTEKPELFIVDSLQTVASDAVDGVFGSVQQSKEAGFAIASYIKKHGIVGILVNQVNKEAELAGSNQVLHFVDAGLIFESEKDSPLKILRAVKNRFGSTEEIGIFTHSETGLEQVTDPSGILSSMETDAVPGAAKTLLLDGIRVFPAEVQALCSITGAAQARRQVSGVDYSRAQMVTAVLDKFCRTELWKYDVFASTVAGLKIRDSQADLALAAALLSSRKDVSIPTTVAFVGEIALTGQIRASRLKAKLDAASRMGIKKVVVPKFAMSQLKQKPSGVQVVTISDVTQLFSILKEF